MLAHDLKFAWRLFVRRPAFTGTAVLILALGIGANTTIFSWMQSVLFSPLSGVTRQDRLLVINGTTKARDTLSTSYPNYVDLRAAWPDGVADLIAFRLLPLNMKAGAEAVRVFGELVTPNFFEFLGVAPALGRGFRAEEGTIPGRDPVAVISDDLWRRSFGADPSVIGRAVSFNGQPFTIVGVTPPGFHGSSAALKLDVFLPVTMQRAVMAGDKLGQRGSSWLEVYARIADGRSAADVRAGVAAAARRLEEANPEINRDRGMRAVPLWRAGAGSLLFPVFGILMAMVALVLLIACANVAGLLLVRAAGRQREMAVRLAVGALYLPVAQQYRPDLVLHVRTDEAAAVVVPSIQAVLRELDPALPLFDVRTMAEHLEISTFIPRLAASMLGFFGVLGLLLAAVGLYGVVGFNAAQRMREIGLRVALGADRRQVVALILRDAAVLVGGGLTAGLLLAFGAGRLLASQLTGVSGTDAVSFAATGLLLAAVAATACAIPAWRAARVSPVVALRRD